MLRLWMLSPWMFDLVIIGVFVLLSLFFSWIVALVVVGCYFFLRYAKSQKK